MKISYSICSAYWKGQHDIAYRMINGEQVDFPLVQERAMSFGKGFHKCMELEAKITKKLPVIFNLPMFTVIGTEVKLYKKITETDWLSGVVDCVATAEINGEKVAVLIDYKTGAAGDKWQSCVYHYLLYKSEWWAENMPNLEPKQFWYLRYNKATEKTQVELAVKLTYPQNDNEWQQPEATTYTAGYNWVLTNLNNIKNDLGIE